MNKVIRFSKKILVLAVLSLMSVSVYAWYNPTYTYSATVQAGLTSSSTGGGLVYVDNEATDYTTVSNSDWRPNSQYDGSEGGNSSNTENATVNVYLYAKENTGYQFEGWTIDSQTGTPGDKGTQNGGVWQTVIQFQVGNNDYGPLFSHPYRDKEYSAYAHFSPIKYYITYDANGGSVSPTTPQEYTIRSTDDLRTPSRNGYTFNGWTVTTTDGNWPAVGNPATSPLSSKYGDVTLTAQWTPTEYTISFSGNGGTGTNPTQIPYTIESTGVTLPANPYTKTGYSFTGWQPASNVGNWATSDTYAAGATVSAGKYGNVTLQAKWDEMVDIVISVSDLQSGESAIFTVAKGSTTLYTVALSAAKPSLTIKNQEPGEYTVTPLSWSWTYSLSSPITKTISSSDHSFSFTANKNTSSKKHDEKSNVNWGNSPE